MQRLREHMQMYGFNTLSTAELLAYLLSFDPTQREPVSLACSILETYGVKGLRNADCDELCKSIGLSLEQAQDLKVICELTERFAIAEPRHPVRITSSADAANLLRPFMMHLDHEELRVLLLDTKNQVIANLLLYSGTVNSSVVRVAEIFKPAIARNCPHIIVGHNHPSMNPTESVEDREFTQQLVEAGKLLEIEVLDHIIIGNPRYVSLKERMLW